MTIAACTHVHVAQCCAPANARMCASVCVMLLMMCDGRDSHSSSHSLSLSFARSSPHCRACCSGYMLPDARYGPAPCAQQPNMRTHQAKHKPTSVDYSRRLRLHHTLYTCVCVCFAIVQFELTPSRAHTHTTHAHTHTPNEHIWHTCCLYLFDGAGASARSRTEAVKRIRFDHVFRKSFLIRPRRRPPVARPLLPHQHHFTHMCAG